MRFFDRHVALVIAAPDADALPMMWFVTIGGTIVYYVSGAAIDAVFPGAHLLGFNVQALVYGSLCMAFMVWLAVRLELFD